MSQQSIELSDSDDESLESENERLGQEILIMVRNDPSIELTFITSLLGSDATLTQFMEYCGFRDINDVPEWMHVYFANRGCLNKN